MVFNYTYNYIMLKQILLELPSFIGKIVGFSPTDKRMYFRDMNVDSFYWSQDGQRLVFINEADLPNDIAPAISVPGQGKNLIGTRPWSGRNSQIAGKLIYF